MKIVNMNEIQYHKYPIHIYQDYHSLVNITASKQQSPKVKFVFTPLDQVCNW